MAAVTTSEKFSYPVFEVVSMKIWKTKRWYNSPDPNVVSNKIIVSNKSLGLLGQGSFYMHEITILQ